MADKYKLKPGEKATVTIELPEPPPAKPRRGYLGEEEIFYPSRRLTTGRINFWDLGMVSTGPAYNQWQMLDFQPSIPASFATSTTAFNSTYHDALLAKIFEVPVEDWRTHYKRIVPEMDYGISVQAWNDVSENIGSTEVLSSSNPNFTNAGLVSDPQWFTSGPFGDYFPTINFSDSSARITFGLTMFGSSVRNHITSTYDIDAPAVDFTPSQKMDIFLVPSLPQMRGRIDSYFAPDGEHIQQLNDFWHLYDRNIFLTPSHDLYGLEGASAFPVEAGLGTVYDAGAFARWSAFLTYMQEFDGARGRYAVGFPPVYGATDDGSNFGAVIPNPYPTFPPNGIGASSEVYVSLMAGNSSALGEPGNQIRLRCVIKQGGQFYYVWNVSYT